MDSENEPTAKSEPKSKRKAFDEMTDVEMRAYCGAFLEDGGWKRSVADADWLPGLNAFVLSARSTGNPRRGIIVTGSCGCGKSAYISAVTHIAKWPVKTIRLAQHEALGLLDCESDNFDRERYEALFRQNVVLDDLGAECLTNSYGIKRDIAGEFIVEYHFRGQRRLYITTNLTAQEIVERYGGRVADRLKELCCPVAFTGKSKRKWATHNPQAANRQSLTSHP